MRMPGLTRLPDAFLEALYALRENRLRTLLSILGIAVGVASVMVVGTVSQEVKQRVFAELESFGLETLWVYRRRDEGDPLRGEREGSGIDNSDLLALANCCPSVRRFSPVVYSAGYSVPLSHGSHYLLANLEGVGLQYLAINRDHLVAGRGLREDDIRQRKAVAIIGRKVQQALFGLQVDPIGRSLRWGTRRLVVIGVLADKQRDLLTRIGANTYDAGKRVLIPYTLYQQQLGSKEIHTLQAQAVSVDAVPRARDEIVQVLSLRHNGRYAYQVDTMERWVATAQDILHRISVTGLLAASISLLVGGIGIMNIMTTSVVERTREIGIRKALGARRRDILLQFLLEAMVVSLIGGTIGLLLALLAILGLSLETGYMLAFSWPMAGVALSLSVAVGVASGYFPARSAASLRPVEALRYD